MKLSIVIVNWNTREMVLGCLLSIYQNIAPQLQSRLETIVVDNCSTDGSRQAIRQKFPSARLIENDVNVGFARANNQAIEQSTGQYVLLLNPDTKVKPGALETMVDFLERHPGAGAVGARILNPDGSLQTSCYPAPSVSRELWYLLHLDSIWSYATYRMDEWAVDVPRAVDSLMGACLMLRSTALIEVGLLDGAFFMYSEEVDLCLRLRKAGWNLFWVPHAEVMHYGGQSTKQVATPMFLQLYQSKIQYFRKHYRPPTVMAYKLVLLLASAVRLSLSPLTWLEDEEKRKRHRKLAANYTQLIKVLPRL